jgi:septal ring factor EnvC (AmiA/AmiB activator)
MPPRQTAAERDIAEALKKLQAKEAADQLALLAKRIADIAEQMATLLERDAQKTATIAKLQKEVEDMHGEVSDIKQYADRWRGGFYAIAGLGAAIGATVACWDRVRLFMDALS